MSVRKVEVHGGGGGSFEVAHNLPPSLYTWEEEKGSKDEKKGLNVLSPYL